MQLNQLDLNLPRTFEAMAAGELGLLGHGQRRVEAVRCTMPAVQAVGDGIEVLLAVHAEVSHQQLTAIEHMLNHRPRKILNLHSPHEVFSALTADLLPASHSKPETAKL